MKRRLNESIEMQVIVSDTNMPIVVDNMCSEWGSVMYPQLSVLLVNLDYLSYVHQTHHWTCRGDSFYGDHQLFQRLYDAVQEEIDSVAERAVGSGTIDNVCIQLRTAQLAKLVQGYNMMQTIPQPSDLARRSLMAEMNFLCVTSKLVESMKECGTLSRGIDDLIASIEDKHETHVYLLKQRITSGA